MINVLRHSHRAQFPLTDNLMSLVFLVQADLNENQRERFVTSMSLRQIDMAQYTYLQVKQLTFHGIVLRDSDWDCWSNESPHQKVHLPCCWRRRIRRGERILGGRRGDRWRRLLSVFSPKMTSGYLVQKEDTRKDMFSIEDSNKEKEKAEVARERKVLDFVHGQKEARAMQQKSPMMINPSSENQKERRARRQKGQRFLERILKERQQLCYYESYDTSQQDQWNYFVAPKGWNRLTDDCLEETTMILPLYWDGASSDQPHHRLSHPFCQPTSSEVRLCLKTIPHLHPN